MSNNLETIEKRHVFADCDDNYGCKVRRSEHNYRQVYEYDKKMKREIANNNERRRMQSINTGFENLKQLLPMSIDGEKLSKASILQLTAKYIQTLLSKLSSLEKEFACFKKSSSSKDCFPNVKSAPCIAQEQSRKRRLNSCSVDAVSFEVCAAVVSDKEGGLSGRAGSCSPLACVSSEKTPGSLEHLVAAIEQVEGETFYAEERQGRAGASSTQVREPPVEAPPAVVPEGPSARLTPHPGCSLSRGHCAQRGPHDAVMKPTISPYTEKILLAASQHSFLFASSACAPSSASPPSVGPLSAPTP